MKPILSMGADPIASASLRTAISFIFLSFTFFLNYKIFYQKSPLTIKILGQSITSGFLGMALGMSLLLLALQKADAGIVATLSSTSPIMILFFIWALIHHLMAGFRHLLLDLQVGNDLIVARFSSKTVLLLSFLLTVTVAYWL